MATAATLDDLVYAESTSRIAVCAFLDMIERHLALIASGFRLPQAPVAAPPVAPAAPTVVIPVPPVPTAGATTTPPPLPVSAPATAPTPHVPVASAPTAAPMPPVPVAPGIPPTAAPMPPVPTTTFVPPVSAPPPVPVASDSSPGRGLYTYLDLIEQHLRKIETNTVAPGTTAPSSTPAPGAAAPGPVAPKPLSAGAGLTTGPAAILGMFSALERGLASFGGAVARFVEKASPITIMRWQQATSDLQAVIGKALVPVLERVTSMVRVLADTFVSLSPQAKQLATGLGIGAGVGGAISALITAGSLFIKVFGGIPVLIGTLVGAFVGVAATMSSGKAIFAAFGGVMKALSSVVEALATVLLPVLEVVLVPILDELAKIAHEAANGLRDIVSGARELLGLGAEQKNKSSVGASVRNAQIGDIQSHINKAYTSAFQATSKEDYAKKSSDTLTDIKNFLLNSEFSKSVRYMPREDSWASTRRPLESVGRQVAGESGAKFGRGVGTGIDALAGWATIGPRGVVAGLRSLFG